jgi:hypothetical protein
MIARVAAGLLVLLSSVVQTMAQSLPAPSTWQNQRGSILTISTIDGSGQFAGKYENRAAGFPCQDTYDMEGAVTGSQVSFVVVWKNANPKNNCNSVTAWRGTLAGNKLSTSWQLAYGNPKSGKIEIKQGRDYFTKQ